jgi:uncharacterized protein (DUF2267 family)
MSATGLDVFDKTIQTTNIWLDEIMAELGPDRQIAWKVLSIVLHKLRDRLSVENAAHLGAQLPLLVRGVYYDQYQPARQPSDCDSIEALAAEVGKWLSDVRPVNTQAAIRAVFGVLLRHVDPGQIAKVQGVLPASIRSFWEAIEVEREPALANG